MAVIGQGFDDAAIADAAMAAFFYHAGQLHPEGCETGDPPIDLDKMIVGDAVDLMAGRLRLGRHGQQFANIVDFEAKLRE